MMAKISTHQTRKNKEIQVRTIMRNNVNMANTTGAFSISVFIGFCHLGFDQYMFSGVGCLNLHTGKFLGALCGRHFHEAINKLYVLEPSV